MAVNACLLGAGIWFVLMLAVITLMRRGLLSEMFAIMWLLLAVIMFLGNVWPRFLNLLSCCVPGQYSLWFLSTLLLFSCLILLYLSVKVTLLSQRVIRLAQELALLNLCEGGVEDKEGS